LATDGNFWMVLGDAGQWQQIAGPVHPLPTKQCGNATGQLDLFQVARQSL
jgi:hypothetical protein